MIENRMPVTSVGKFDFVVKKNSARHGAFAGPSEAVASLAGSDIFAELAWLVPEKGRLLCRRFCSTAGGMRKVSKVPYAGRGERGIWCVNQLEWCVVSLVETVH
jgi:hypothetical protein